MKNKEKPLKGKSAIVTGGATRIGRAISIALAENGANVIIHHFSSEKEAIKTVSLVREKGVQSYSIQADFSRISQAEKLFSRIYKKAGKIDFLINNASVFPQDRLPTLQAKDLYTSLNINALSPLVLVQNFAKQTQKGAVINLLDSRILGFDLKHASYQFGKNLLRDITKMAAAAFAPGIRVNAIAPGIILPPQGKGTSYLKKLHHRNFLGREGKEKDITDALIFLLLSPFITGQIIFVDGGQNFKGTLYGQGKADNG